MVASRYQPQQKALLRVSLRTKNKGVATQLSWKLSVHIDSIVQEHLDCPEKLYDALDTLRTKIIKGILPAAEVMTNGSTAQVEPHDAVHAELRKFRNNSNKLLLKFSDLIDAISTEQGSKSWVKNQSMVCPTISEDDNPTVSKLFADWVDESTMRKLSLDSTYKPVIDLFIRFVDRLHEDEVRV